MSQDHLIASVDGFKHLKHTLFETYSDASVHREDQIRAKIVSVEQSCGREERSEQGMDRNWQCSRARENINPNLSSHPFYVQTMPKAISHHTVCIAEVEYPLQSQMLDWSSCLFADASTGDLCVIKKLAIHASPLAHRIASLAPSHFFLPPSPLPSNSLYTNGVFTPSMISLYISLSLHQNVHPAHPQPNDSFIPFPTTSLNHLSSCNESALGSGTRHR